MKMYVVWAYSLESPRRGDSNEYTQNIIIRKDIPKFAFCPGVMINPQWLKLPISRTTLHGTKAVRAIEIRLDCK